MITGADVDRYLQDRDDWEYRDGQWYDEYDEPVEGGGEVYVSTSRWLRENRGYPDYEPITEEIEYYLTGEEQEIVVKGVGSFKLEVAWGGEGDGARKGYVIKFNPENGDDAQYFEKTGYYSSWDSDYFDGGWTEVEPYEKVVTRYREVKR